jgi:glycosyltransferase involved in cell wall biosynthesis
MGGSVKLSVLMPVFNERYLVEACVRRVLAFRDPRVHGLELVVVDDGSTDGTREILAALARELPELRYFPQPENRGKGAAVREAVRHATGDLCVIQDADLEYDPRDWSELLVPFFEANADVVYGSRFAASQYRRVLYFRHSLGNHLITGLSNLMTDLNLTDVETCYKMVRTSLLRSIPIRSDDFSFEPEITAKLAKRGAVFYEVPIHYQGRTYLEGKKITWRHGPRAIREILRWKLRDDLYRDDEHGAHILSSLNHVQNVNRWMAEQLQPFLGDRVLEIGAGIGNLTMFLIPRRRYVATDIDPGYLDVLRNLSVAKPYLEVRRVDLSRCEDFDALAGQFDTVVCLNVLEHVPDEDTALANLRRVLVPGGRALVLVPQGPWLFGSLDRALDHVKRYTPEDLRVALTSAGFEVETLVDFNRVGVLGWALNGRLLGRERLSRAQLKLLNTVIPAWKTVDAAMPWPGLSVIAVARRPAEPSP